MHNLQTLLLDKAGLLHTRHSLFALRMSSIVIGASGLDGGGHSAPLERSTGEAPFSSTADNGATVFVFVCVQVHKLRASSHFLGDSEKTFIASL